MLCTKFQQFQALFDVKHDCQLLVSRRKFCLLGNNFMQAH